MDRMIRPVATLVTRPIVGLTVEAATKAVCRSSTSSISTNRFAASNANTNASNAAPCFDNANTLHGGIPIGAVQLGSSHVQPFRDLIDRTLRTSVQDKNSKIELSFRGVQPFVGPSNQLTNTGIDIAIDMGGQHGGHEHAHAHERLLLIHVPPAVATALDDGHPELTDFLKQNDGAYIPGLRRSRTHRRATRRKRFAQPHTLSKVQVQSKPNTNTDSKSNISLDFGKQQVQADPIFTFSELFAGIGGFRLGLEAIGGKCVFANEIDPYAASIYRRNFVKSDSDCHLIEADILDICAKTDIPPDIDILTAGFPCQPFSTRGKQGGLSDERGQLYREIVRVLRHSRPKSFIFENVTGLVNMGEGGGGRFRGHGVAQARGEAGSVFKIILSAFEECGYNVTWNICNSRHYVAQQRERVYIVGVRNDLVREHTFSWDWYDQILQSSGRSDAGAISVLVRDIMDSPDSLAVSESELSPLQWAKLQETHSTRSGGIIKNTCIDIDAKAPTLISSYRRSGNLSSKYIFNERDRTEREIPRFLTPRECCRLMGFPEDYYVPSISIDGDTETAHFYAGIGNAVVPPVIASIGKEVVDYLRS